jgi:hypothetical protein
MNFSCPDWENLVGNFLAHCVKDPTIDACIFAMGLVVDAYLNQQKKINFTWKDFKKSHYHIPKLDNFQPDKKVGVEEKYGMPRKDGCSKNPEKFGIEFIKLLNSEQDNII